MDKLYFEADEICKLLKIKRSTLNWWISEKREIYPYLTKIGKRPVLTPVGLAFYLGRTITGSEV